MARRLPVSSGVLALAAAGVLALLPLRANGVSGNALTPSYHDFGWVSYEPVPDDPTLDDLRRLGVPVPQDVVTERRWLVAATAGVGVVLLLVGELLRRRDAG